MPGDVATPERDRTPLFRYGVAIAITVLSLFVRWPLWPILGNQTPHMTFFPAVMISAYYGGFGPGLLSTILSGLAAHYFLGDTRFSFQIGNIHGAVALTLFLLVGTVISGLSESLHRMRRRIVADERRRAGEALLASEERFRCTFENAAVGIAHNDLQGRWLRVNQTFCDILGYTRAELLEKTFHDVSLPDELEVELAQHARLIRGERPSYSLEKHIRRKDGTIGWINVTVSLQRNSSGAPAYTIAIVQDISVRKNAEQALRLANSRLDTAVRGSNVGIWEIDLPDGTFLNGRGNWINAWEQLGHSPPQTSLEATAWLPFLHPEDRERIVAEIDALLRGTGSDFEIEYRARHQDGTYRWMLSRGTIVRDAAGKPIRWTGSRVDVTDFKRIESELRQAKEGAEAANRAKDEFLANVSHEIRTPMNAILGMTELALDTPLTDDQRQILRTAKSAADNLLGLINDLLDFSKIEAGRLELDVSDFPLRSVVGDTLRALAARAEVKGLELLCHIQADVPDPLVGDAGRLRQILLNLAGNAIKFTDAGEVVVRVAVARPVEDGNIALRFTVSDTGIGIPRDKQETIFRAFEQEDSSITRKYGGTGLGLTISARLVTLMGGAITVDSEPGRGSTFAFTARFKLQPESADPVSAHPPVVPDGIRVLVVDDNATNRLILEEWLRRWRIESTAVADGQAAMNALNAAAADNRPFAVALLDSRMPDTDGIALAARIREKAEFSSTHIILLTSDGRGGDLASLRQLRIDASLLKPAQPEELLQTLCRVITPNQSDARRDPKPPTFSAQPAVPPVRPLSVLVAEDNEFNAQLVEQILVRRGHRVALARDGREALALAEQSAFDLLILDIHMPELDGFEVVNAIRSRELQTGKHLPVIALTARSRREDREKCLAAGMDEFLTKPFRADDLWTAIDRLVWPPAMAASPGSQMSQPPGSIDPKLLDPKLLDTELRHIELLDTATILSACGGDDALLRKMCQSFQTRIPDRLAAVVDALRQRDAPRLRESAHKICGMVATFSEAAGDVASKLEDCAARAQIEECRPLVSRLETMIAALLELLANFSLETAKRRAEAGDHPEAEGTLGQFSSPVG